LPPFACDLHVLGMPPAFNLSQDQTLQLKNWRSIFQEQKLKVVKARIRMDSALLPVFREDLAD
jgi:hypothetical protein